MLCFKIAEIETTTDREQPSVGFCESKQLWKHGNTGFLFFLQREWLFVTSAQLWAHSEELEPNWALSA